MTSHDWAKRLFNRLKKCKIFRKMFWLEFQTCFQNLFRRNRLRRIHRFSHQIITWRNYYVISFKSGFRRPGSPRMSAHVDLLEKKTIFYDTNFQTLVAQPSGTARGKSTNKKLFKLYIKISYFNDFSVFLTNSR